jgi:hypothetical protein
LGEAAKLVCTEDRETGDGFAGALATRWGECATEVICLEKAADGDEILSGRKCPELPGQMLQPS